VLERRENRVRPPVRYATLDRRHVSGVADAAEDIRKVASKGVVGIGAFVDLNVEAHASMEHLVPAGRDVRRLPRRHVRPKLADAGLERRRLTQIDRHERRPRTSERPTLYDHVTVQSGTFARSWAT